MSEEQAKGEGGLIAKMVAMFARNSTVFGSDVYNSYTFEYVWGANQFGHVLIGLFPTLLLSWIFGSVYVGFIAVVAVYALKEIIDYLIAVSLVENVFQPNRRETIVDGLVDWGFVVSGAFTAAAVLGDCGLVWKIAAFATPVVFFLLMRLVYLPGKKSFDRSGLPKFVRLPTFPENFVLGADRKQDWTRYDAAKADFVDRISKFAANDANLALRQIVIAGPRSSGRSTFAMAIGGEAATGYGTGPLRVRHVSAAQLHEITNDRFEVASKSRPWCVGEADIVIVDELDPLLVPTDSAEAARAAIDALVDVKRKDFVGLTVFERPLGIRNPAHVEGGTEPKWIAGPKRQGLPRIVWVAGHHGMNGPEAHRRGENLRLAIAAKFGASAASPAATELVKLEGKIFEKRTTSKARAGQEVSAPDETRN